MSSTCRWLLVSFAFLWVASEAAPVRAQLGRDELKCRETTSKRALKLIGKAMKYRADCHRLRSAGIVPTGVDCNDLFQADPARKLVGLAATLRRDVVSACADTNPASVGHLDCPWSCRATVPAIATFQDVADCIVCLVENQTRTISVNGQGLPNPPLAAPTLSCHTAIGKTQSKLLQSILAERRKCQTAAERGGAIGISGCRGADTGGKIEKAELEARAAFERSCRDAEVTALDSCSFFGAVNVETCVFETVRTVGDELFEALYGLRHDTDITTTTFGGSTTSLTMSSTTTLGGRATCEIIVRATTAETLGALRYEVGYGVADGGFAGSGTAVSCTNLVGGSSASFFDDDAGHLRESVISLAGFNTPADLARCVFETDGASVTASDFTVTVLDASTPDLMPADPTVAIGTIQCVPG